MIAVLWPAKPQVLTVWPLQKKHLPVTTKPGLERNSCHYLLPEKQIVEDGWPLKEIARMLFVP